MNNYRDYLSDRASADLAARKGSADLVLEVKSLLYAKLKRLRSLYGGEYGFWHTRYHFSPPDDALKALASLRMRGGYFYDERHDKEASIAELYREALSFVVDGRFKEFKRRYVGVVTPWFMDGDEKDVLWECLGKLRDYLLDVHGLDVEVLHFEYRILLRDSMPYMLEMKAVHGDTLKLDVSDVKIEDVVEVSPCISCRYWSEGWCLGGGGL
ncbi:MAG TPA: hypothetical protein ENF87_02730 [Thermoproteales archaeon]|nr:hypothetical protein [Thermoproteales archaeon]